jgi:hypothetical protein
MAVSDLLNALLVGAGFYLVVLVGHWLFRRVFTK